jgi:hypothetical protein
MHAERLSVQIVCPPILALSDELKTVRWRGFLNELFKGRLFDREVVVLCVRWYLRFKLSCRDLVEMMAEGGLSMAHTTTMRWVQRYVPEFERRWTRLARPAGAHTFGAEEWEKDTAPRDGSRWVEWNKSLDQRSTDPIDPPRIGAPGFMPQCDARGLYVREG